MKIKTKIFFLIGSIALIFIVGISIIKIAESERINKLIEEREKLKEAQLSETVNLIGKNLETYAYDYSYWDEMVQFLSTADSNWAYQNIEITMPTFNAQAAFVYNKDFSLIYSINVFNDSSLLKLPLSNNEFNQLISKSHFTHFFFECRKGLIEVRGAPIQRGDDNQRISKPLGFYFVARLWNYDYLKKIESILSSKLKIINPEEKLSYNQSDYEFINSLNLTSWNGKPIKKLISISSMSVLIEHSKLFNLQFFALITFSILVFLSTLFFLLTQVNNPLSLIYKSLTDKNPAILNELANSKSEFGSLSNLIKNFFNQQNELINEIDERKKTEVLLKESEIKNKALINAIPDLMFTFSFDGRFLTWKSSSKELLLMSPDEFIGKKFHDVLPKYLADLTESYLKKILETSEPQIFEYNLVIHDQLYYFEARMVLCGNNEVLAIIRNISERKLHERNLSKLNRLYAVISQVNQTIVRTRTREKLFEEICRVAVEHGKFIFAWIAGINEQNRVIIPLAKHGYENELLSKIKLSYHDSSESITEIINSLNHGTIFVSNNLTTDKRLTPWTKESIELGFQSLAIIPIKTNDILIGSLNLYSDEVDFFDDYEIYLLEKISSDITFALDSIDEEKRRKEAEELLRQSEERWQITVEASGDGMFDWNIQNNDCFYTLRWKTLLGYEEHEINNRLEEWENRIHPEDINFIKKRIEKHLKGESPFFAGDYRMKCKNGEYRWFYWKGKVIKYDAVGNPERCVGTNTDINNRKIAERAVAESQTRLDAIINSAMDAIISVDLSQKIVMFNPSAENMFDLKAEKVIGSDISILMPERFRKKHSIHFTNFAHSQSSHLKAGTSNIVWGLRGNIEFPMEVSISKIEINGELYFTAILRDITERKKLEIEIIAAKEKAEEMNRLKTNFLANMSHELRTPMIGILGYSEILKNLGENQEERDMADTIYRGGTRLLETLNLILDFSRIESDKLSIKYTNVNIVQVANTVLEQFDYLALKKELSIIKQYEDNSIFAESDERLLSLILKNLISNALKFTKQGFVKLEIQRENSFVVLKVKDTGIGISKEDEKIIFNEFRQVSEGFGRGFEGVGLGLTLVKKFVEKMNGLIFTQSKVGVGTEFIVKLPIVQNATVNQEYEIPITSKKRILLDTKKATHKLPEILVVEDDAINQQVIKLYIKSVCAMELAENADDAIKKVKEKNYSAILMDINLGRNSSGLEATKEIRKLDNYKHTPIVAITAFAMAGDKEEFLKAGCTHYLAKPFNRKTLVQLIEEILIKS